MVIHRGRDRGFNNLMVGSIGSGMIAALVLPVINQDLHHMTFMINNYEKYFTLGNIHTSEIKGKFLNGLSIIEPTKHLCDSTLKLVKAIFVPKEEFIEAKIKVNDEAAKKWLEYHNNF